MTFEEIIDDFPELTINDFKASLRSRQRTQSSLKEKSILKYPVLRYNKFPLLILKLYPMEITVIEDFCFELIQIYLIRINVVLERSIQFIENMFAFEMNILLDVLILKINLIIKYRQKAQLVIGNNGLIRIGIIDFVGCPGQVQDILGTENIDQVKRYFMA